jgi:hypothetical protein
MKKCIIAKYEHKLIREEIERAWLNMLEDEKDDAIRESFFRHRRLIRKRNCASVSLSKRGQIKEIWENHQSFSSCMTQWTELFTKRQREDIDPKRIKKET